MANLSTERVAEIDRILTDARSPKLRQELLDTFKEAGPALPPGAIEAQVTLYVETDRGCVLVGGAYLDELLTRLLRAAMLHQSKTVDGLLKPGGALADFLDRAKTAYAFGLIGKIEYSELEIIAQIRNKCAHLLDASSFEWSGVTNLTAQLRSPIILPVEVDVEVTPRRRFVAAVSLLASFLLRRIPDTKHAPVRDESDIAHVFRPKTER